MRIMFFNRICQQGCKAKLFISQWYGRQSGRCKLVCRVAGAVLILVMLIRFLRPNYVEWFQNNGCPKCNAHVNKRCLQHDPGPTMRTMYLLSTQKSNHLFMYQGQLVIPPRAVLETLSRLELEDLYHRYVENIQYSCRNQIHYGKESDGGYFICEDVPIAKPCLMYSFGTRNDYGFDDRIAYDVGCEVHSFDPGDGQQSHKRSDQVWFHALGLGGSTRIIPAQINEGPKKDRLNKWVIYDLSDVRLLLEHQKKTLHILKIDTEGMIWETLEDLARPGVIDDVRLLIMELHINFPAILSQESYRSAADYVQHLDSLRRLYDLGFRMYYFQKWDACVVHDDAGRIRTGCHDVHFIQTKYIDLYNPQVYSNNDNLSPKHKLPSKTS